MSTVPLTLQNLRRHSIFTPSNPSSPPPTTDEEWQLVSSPASPSIPPRNSLLVTRDRDVILALPIPSTSSSSSSSSSTRPSPLRMTTLPLSSPLPYDTTASPPHLGTYKTLSSPSLDFAIRSLSLSPNGKLLAVVGDTQVSVVVLPRSGSLGAHDGEVGVRAFRVDEWTFRRDGKERVTGVKWHEWGEGGRSLWVLSSNGRLREFDVLQPYDPLQTFNFLSTTSSPTPASSKFSAVDPLSRYATAFTFCPLPSPPSSLFDPSPLMVHCLFANGDIYTLGPVLPLHAELPMRYLQGLGAFAEAQVRRREQESGSLARAIMLRDWIGELTRQVRDEQRNKTLRKESAEGDTATSPLTKGVKVSMSPAKGRREPPKGMVRVHPPHLTESGGPAPGVHRLVMRQGPMMLSPGLEEVGNPRDEEEEEDVASDLVVLDVEGDEGERERVFVVCWSGGRVDLGVETKPAEPRWISSRDPSPSTPALGILECHLLPFPSSSSSTSIRNAPSIHVDPINPSTIYIAHVFGLDAITFDVNPAAAALTSVKVDRLVDSTTPNSIVGMAVFCTISLGYGLLAVAERGQVAAVELHLDVHEDSVDAGSPDHDEKTEPEQPDERSLLLAEPFDFDRLVSRVKPSPSPASLALAKVRKLPDTRTPIQNITPVHLRSLGEITSQLHAFAQTLRSASQAIEARLDLQVEEYQRQLALLKDCKKHVREMRAKNGTKDRVEALKTAQKGLEAKMEGVIGTLDGVAARREVSEKERGWFDELERLKGKVGDGGARMSGLVGRAQTLDEQLEEVKSELAKQAQDEVDEEEGGRGTDGERPPPRLGSKQLAPIEQVLGKRADEIRKMMRKLEGLNLRVEEAVGEDSDDD